MLNVGSYRGCGLLSLEQVGLTDLRFVLAEWNAVDLSCLGLGNFSINFGLLILIFIYCVGFCFLCLFDYVACLYVATR